MDRGGGHILRKYGAPESHKRRCCTVATLEPHPGAKKRSTKGKHNTKYCPTLSRVLSPCTIGCFAQLSRTSARLPRYNVSHTAVLPRPHKYTRITSATGRRSCTRANATAVTQLKNQIQVVCMRFHLLSVCLLVSHLGHRAVRPHKGAVLSGEPCEPEPRVLDRRKVQERENAGGRVRHRRLRLCQWWW